MPTLADYHAPYPEAPVGMKRCVIYLDPKDEVDELSHLKIELIPGRITYCEDPKRNFISGAIEERTIEGWGYDYYTVQMGGVVDKQGNAVSGRNSIQFVPLVGTGPNLRYNSKLPIVVYAPQDAEVRYRVWSDETVRAQDRNSVTTRGGLSETTAPPAERKEEERAVLLARPASQPEHRTRATKPISSAYTETGLSSTEVSPSRRLRGSTSSAPFSSNNASKSRSAAVPTTISSREAGAPVEAHGFNAEPEQQYASGSRSRHRNSAKRITTVEESPSRMNRGADGTSPRRGGEAEGAGARSPPRHHSLPRGDKTLYDRMSPRRSSSAVHDPLPDESDEEAKKHRSLINRMSPRRSSSAVQEPLPEEAEEDNKKHRSLINRMRKKGGNSNPNSPQRSHRKYDEEL